MDSLGGCVFANDFPYNERTQKILQDRIDGRSWKDISDELDMSPSQTRKYFKGSTGIDDFKVKGKDLQKLADSTPKPSKVSLKTAGSKKHPSPSVPQTERTRKAQRIVDELQEQVRQSQLVKNSVMSGSDEAYTKRMFADSHRELKWQLETAKKNLIAAQEEAIKEHRLLKFKEKKRGKPLSSSPKNVPMGKGAPPPPGRAVIDKGYSSPEFPMLSSDAMEAMNPVFTGHEADILRSYTYDAAPVNRTLRGFEGYYEAAAEQVRVIDAVMARSETTTPITVTRGMRMDGFGLGEDFRDVKSLVGKTIQDKGYVSTSAKVDGTFATDVRLVIEVPPGTRGAYLEKVSDSPHELEFLIDRSTPMVITSAEKKGREWVVRARVLV